MFRDKNRQVEKIIRRTIRGGNYKANHSDKRQSKPKGSSRMDNQAKMSASGTQDTGRRQTTQKKTT